MNVKKSNCYSKNVKNPIENPINILKNVKNPIENPIDSKKLSKIQLKIQLISKNRLKIQLNQNLNIAHPYLSTCHDFISYLYMLRLW